MLIVIDGVDCTGKTTLARTLKYHYGFEYRHAGPPTSHALDEYVASLEGFNPFCDRVVLDRFHLGELVWPRVFERDSTYVPEVHRYVELFLRSRGALIVACDGDDEDVRRRLETRGDHALQPEQVKNALQLFRDAFAASHLPRTAHSIEFPTSVDELVRRAHNLAWDASRTYEVTPEYVGSSDVDVLLVGDEIGSGSGGMRVPFVPRPGTSGFYLMSAIDDVQYDVGVTNSTAPVANLCTRLGLPRVVALGNNATKRLSDAGVPHGIVPHPQYVRRFHHAERERYARDIARAAFEVVDCRKEWSG